MRAPDSRFTASIPEGVHDCALRQQPASLTPKNRGVLPCGDTRDRLELIAHGEVVASVNSTPGTEELTLSHRLNPGEGLWLAIRAKGKGIGVAHSAPVYVEVGGKPHTFAREAVPALVDGYIGVIDEAMRAEPQEFEDLEHWDTGSDIARQWAAQLPALREHAEQAKARLLEIRAAAVAVPGSP